MAAYQFADEKTARAFATSEGVGGYLPIDTGRHVYTNWDALLEKRVGHPDAMNPFNFPANQGLQSNYSLNMCPRTLDLVNPTVFIALNPDWTEEDITSRIEACRKAAASL